MTDSFVGKIKRYEAEIFDFDASPFETIAILHLRSKLENEFQNMDSDEQLQLLSVDIKVIQNAEKITGHISEVYDFTKSEKPETEWWWHLDKVSSGNIIVKSHPLYTTKDIAL